MTEWTLAELCGVVAEAMGGPRCGACRFYLPERELCIRKHHVQCALEPWVQGCNGRWFKLKEAAAHG